MGRTYGTQIHSLSILFYQDLAPMGLGALKWGYNVPQKDWNTIELRRENCWLSAAGIVWPNLSESGSAFGGLVPLKQDKFFRIRGSANGGCIPLKLDRFFRITWCLVDYNQIGRTYGTQIHSLSILFYQDVTPMGLGALIQCAAKRLEHN